MSLNFERIKKVNPKITNLIFGYFREIHKKHFDSDNPYYSLQPLLIYTCIAFYFKHEWNTEKMSQDVNLSNDSIITKIAQDNTTVLLAGEISSGCHEYEFKIIECTEAFNGGWFDIVIGIIDSTVLERHPDIETEFAFYNGYYYCGTDQELHFHTNDGTVILKENVECKNGSIIKLKADLDNLELEYFVDNQSVAIIKRIEKATYIVGVYLYCLGTKIELLQ